MNSDQHKTNGPLQRNKHREQPVPDTRIFLIRHGQPVQHSGKIFLGQSDIPLSQRGKGEADAAGDRLLSLGARPRRIYASDLSRAMETADIIAGKLGGVPVIPDILFREMAMGTWDGELVDDIRKKFPEEFEKRGDDLRNYRTPGGENFYDLHGRVTREFYRIFTEDFRRFTAQGSNHGDMDGSSGGLAALGDNPGGLATQGDSPGDTSDGPGDLVIVAHFGVLVTLTEELQIDVPDAGNSFATGSVTVIDVPDWLWA